MSDAVNNYVGQFRAMGLDGVPATEWEIEQLENSICLPLPPSYKAYLLIAGQRPPSAWVGSDCTVRHLLQLRADADRLMRENGQPPLPANAFVFLMHQGYQFFYFEADRRQDDPPVFYYLEGDPKVVRRFERFSELVSLCAADGGAS